MDTFKQGVQYFRAGAYSSAIEEFDKAIALHGPKIEVMDSKAAAYEKLGDLGTALQVGRQCVKMFPASTKGYLRCSRVFELRKDWSRAVQMLELALPLSPASRRSELERRLLDLQRRVASPGTKQRDPVKALPAELWREIMLYLVEENADCALTIAQVSKEWRTKTLTEPAAWSRLCVGERKPRGVKALKKISIWIERSCGKLTSVDIDLRFAAHGKTTETRLDVPEAREALDLLRPTAPHIRSLRLNGLSQELHKVDLHEWRGTMKNLRVLVYSDRTIESRIHQQLSPVELDLGLLPPDSSGLCHLGVHGVLVCHARKLNFDLKALRSCDLHVQDLWDGPVGSDVKDPGSMSVPHALLRLASNLEELSLKVDWAGAEPTFIPPQAKHDNAIWLPHLKKVKFHGAFSSNIGYLSMPALEDITISRESLSTRRNDIPFNLDVLFDYGSVDPARLTSLSVEGEASQPLRFCEILDKMQALQFLHFRLEQHETGIVEHLSRHPERWKSLQSVSIQGLALTGGPVIRLVQSRLPRARGSKAAARTIKSRSIFAPADDKKERPTSEESSEPGASTPVEAITSLILKHCPNVEKTAEDWLRSTVPAFLYIPLPPPKPSYRDKYGR